jgi:hypothetical protein
MTASAVQPVAFEGRVVHRVFAAHLVGEGGYLELVRDAPRDVQVGHARLDHDHVRTLGEIQGALVQGFVAVRRVHLVAELVATLDIAGGTHRIAERTVIAGGILGRVGHDQRVDVAVCLERLANRSDAPVHHVRRRDDIGTGRRVAEGLLDQVSLVRSLST